MSPVWLRSALLLLLLAGLACTQQSSLPELPSLESLGLDEALPVVREQIEAAFRDVERSPRDAQANGHLGMVLSTYRHTQQALALYQRARALDPMAFNWAYYEAFTEVDLGQTLDAIESFENALSLNSAHPGARAKLAELRLQSGDAETGKALFADLVHDHPERPDAHYGLGRTLAAIGNDEAAIKALNEALRLAPGTGEIHYALAEVYRRTEDPDLARQHYELHQRFEKNRLRPRDELLIAVGNLNRSDAPHMAKGRYFSAINRYAAAVTEFESAIAVNPENAAAYSERVAAFIAGGDHESAVIAYREGLEQASMLASLHFHGGQGLAASGDLSAAAEALERARELDPNRADIAWTLATVRERQDDRVSALELLKTAHELEPDNRDYRYRYGSKLLEAGDHDGAIGVLEPLATTQAADSPAHLQVLAMAYNGRGDVNESIELLEAALEVSRKTGDVRRAGEIASQLDRLKTTR